jgi:GT2 family glycosyltransferase
MGTSMPSLKTQTYRPLDVLVWDASDEGQTSEDIRAGGPASDVHVVWKQAPRRGLSSQRNDAVKDLSCDIVVLMDDDVALEEQAIEALVSCLSGDDPERRQLAGAQCAMTTGAVRSHSQARHMLARAGRWLLLMGYAGRRQYVRLSGHAAWLDPALIGGPDPSEHLYRMDLEWITGGCSGYRMDVIRREGIQFEERLERFGGYAAGEDVLFSGELHKRGWLLGYCYGARALHMPSASGRESSWALAATRAYNRSLIWNRLCRRRAWAVPAYVWSIVCDTGVIALHSLVALDVRSLLGWFSGLWASFHTTAAAGGKP